METQRLGNQRRVEKAEPGTAIFLWHQHRLQAELAEPFPQLRIESVARLGQPAQDVEGQPR